MTIKMIAFDLDGTLLNAEHQLSEKTIEAVKKVREKGVKTLVATGRMFKSAKPHINRLGVTDPAITYNGALVVNPKTEEQLFHSPLPLEIAKKITKLSVENDYYLQLYIDDQLYISEENKYTREYNEISGIKANVVGNLYEFLESEPTKMLILEEDKAKRVEIKNFLHENFADEIELSSSYSSFIEITKKNISKALPLEKIADNFGIKQEEVMAFGDGLNDLKMIQWAGKGVAMQNAHPELQENADDTAADHDDYGIARYLKKHFKLDLEII